MLILMLVTMKIGLLLFMYDRTMTVQNDVKGSGRQRIDLNINNNNNRTIIVSEMSMTLPRHFTQS